MPISDIPLPIARHSGEDAGRVANKGAGLVSRDGHRGAGAVLVVE